MSFHTEPSVRVPFGREPYLTPFCYLSGLSLYLRDGNNSTTLGKYCITALGRVLEFLKAILLSLSTPDGNPWEVLVFFFLPYFTLQAHVSQNN